MSDTTYTEDQVAAIEQRIARKLGYEVRFNYSGKGRWHLNLGRGFTEEECYSKRNFWGSMDAAWEIIGYVKKLPFGERRVFFGFLRSQFRADDGPLLAWPEAMIFCKPQHICLAFTEYLDNEHVPHPIPG